MDKPFTTEQTTNAYGRTVTGYRTKDGRYSVERELHYSDGYWWVKLRSQNAPSDDGALNIRDVDCMSLAAIFQDMHDRFNK